MIFEIIFFITDLYKKQNLVLIIHITPIKDYQELFFILKYFKNYFYILK